MEQRSAVTCDSSRNTISGNGWTFLYDAENRMRQAHNGISALFEYNPLGQRVKKNGLNGTEYFVYDEMGRLLGVYDGTGQPKEEIVWFDGWKAVATMRGQGISSQMYFIDSDHLNAPIAVRDGSGKTIWTWDNREPFGLQRPNEDPDGDMQYFYLNLRFPGQWFDNETGLFHNGFRDYNPQLGRYMQSDPLGLEAGFNTYSYVNGNPYRSVDPYGLIERDQNRNIKKKYFGEPGTAKHGNFEADMQAVWIKTDRGREVKALEYVEGDYGMRQNCHGYALDLPFWIQHPNTIFEDEYVKINNIRDIRYGDIIHYTDKYTNEPIHSTKVVRSLFPFQGKNGGYEPIIYDHPLIHIKNNNITIYRKK